MNSERSGSGPRKTKSSRRYASVGLANVVALTCGEAPRASGQSGRTLAATKRVNRRAASASGLTPCISEEKRGFSPESGERPADRSYGKLGRVLLRPRAVPLERHGWRFLIAFDIDCH